VHDRKDRFSAIRESLLECQLALAPWEIGRDQLGNIGIDGEMLRGVGCCRDTEDDGQKDDGTCVPNA
jgi:hypothetical protein